ncbi:MAG: hypothetical protein AMXMBFR81_16110 [Chthonomonas sp.]|nr:hypothetical protein [Fimbriimonadaceae bacterium]
MNSRKGPAPPQHLSSLMWVIAESQDRQGLAEFAAKHPEFAEEMNKRFAMVSGLRGSRPGHIRQTHVPPFKRRPVEQPAAPRWVWAAAFVGLCALGYASYELAKSYAGPPPTKPVAEVRTPAAGGQGFENVTPPQPTLSGSQNPGASQAHDQTQQGAPDNLRSVELTDVDLRTALQAIAAQTGYQIELAPGFPEKHLARVSYTQLTGLDMLRDMGARLGFTVFEQERNRLLLVPAVDPAAPTGRPLGDVQESSPGPHEGPVDQGSRAKTPHDPTNDTGDGD